MEEQMKSQQKGVQTLRIVALVGAVILVIVACVMLLNKPWERVDGIGSNTFLKLLPKSISLTPVQYRGVPFPEEKLAETVADEKSFARSCFAPYQDRIQFSDGFHYVWVDDTGNYIDRDRINYLILYDRKIVGSIVIWREGDGINASLSGGPEVVLDGSADPLTELLQQYQGSELAMLMLNGGFAVAVTPDGVLHPLDDEIPDSIPRQNDEYYKLFHLEDNCIKGID